MSTLSELIPSGGTQNNIEFVAQGTLANGQTVALRSDGKVEAISIAAQAIGTAVVFEAAAITLPRCSYNPDQDITLVTYEQNSRIHCVAVKVNGSSMTIGTPIEPFGAFSSFGNDAVTFDSNRNQHVLVALNNNGSNHGFMVIVTASGTSLTATGKATLNSSGATSSFFCAYDPTADRSVVGYRDGGNSGYLTCVAITNSGSSLSVGSKFVYRSNANCYNNEGIYSPVVKKVACSFKDGANGNTIMMYGFTITGTTPSYYAASSNLTAVTAGQYPAAWMSYDSTADRFILGYTATSDEAHYATAVQWSGSSFIAGTAKKVSPSAHGYGYVSLVFDPDANITYYSYRYNTASYQFPLTVSGSTITVGTSVTMPGRADPALAAYDTTNNKVIYGFADGNNSNYGTVQSFTSALSNASSFVGITNAAISSGATGEVAVKGGLSTGGNVLSYAPVAGTPVTFEAAYVNYTNCAFDSASNKIVIAYTDTGNSNYGTAIVGTVSGSSISYGSPVVIATNQARYFAVVFDSNANKIVIAYQNQDNTYGQAIVGTVSGTSISFGTAVTFEAAQARYVNAAFDSTVNKVIISYRDDGNSSHGTAIVGTVSGTSISFGTAAVYNAAETAPETTVYDSSTNKTVILYSDVANSYYATAVVATVSGTSISFGSEVVIHSGSTTHIAGAFDSNSNKVVVAYGGSSTLAKSRVGTVSGTSISFGTEATMIAGGGAYDIAATFDSTLNQMVVSFNFYNGSSSQGIIVAGTVSGTNISFGATTVFDTGPDQIYHLSSAFDTNANRTVTVYQAQNDNNYGKAVVSALSNTLTIGSNYFVQDDGSLATTSSSNKAGKAISTTALNLVDPI